jgi:hypothetical protein
LGFQPKGTQLVFLNLNRIKGKVINNSLEFLKYHTQKSHSHHTYTKPLTRY